MSELRKSCGDEGHDVLELALHFANHIHTPEEPQALREFIFNELRSTLTRYASRDVADRTIGEIAAMLLETTGIHRITSPPPADECLRAIASPISPVVGIEAALHPMAEVRLTKRPRISHAREIGPEVHRDYASTTIVPKASLSRALMPTPHKVHSVQPSRSAEQAKAAHPVLLLSDFPSAAADLQDALATNADVMLHDSLDFFESDSLILRPRNPVVVLDCRGSFADYAESFLGRCDPDMRVVAWGLAHGERTLPGKRMLSCLGNIQIEELAMLVGVFLPNR